MNHLSVSRILSHFLPALLASAPVGLAQATSPFVSGAWCGNVSSSSATVCIRLNAPALRTRLAVSTDAQLASPFYSATQTTTAGNGHVAALDIAGLHPNTEYYYGVEVAGVLRTEPVSRGRFRTFPQGAGSFKLALIGDGENPIQDPRVYAAVIAENPLLLLFNGDLHYGDLLTNVVEDYRALYDGVLRQSNEGSLFRGAAVAYIWDDHDFSGGNNANGTALGAAAARTAYREYVPHYPLAAADGSIGQAFTVGRVRVIMTDLRSASTPPTDAESAAKSRLGAVQKAWFKQELLGARDAGFPLILWMSSVPWIGAARIGDDTWAGYATERTEIANFLRDNRIRNLVIFAGDMHSLAYDDGTHSDYATGGGAPVFVLHAAPLTRQPNAKGGPFTAGPLLNSEQYGTLEVTDTGGPAIQCRFAAKRVGEGSKLFLEFTASAAGIEQRAFAPIDLNADRTLVNVSARGRIDQPTESLIVGFVIGGRTRKYVLMRAVGPSLAAFGVSDALPFPALSLYQGATVIASNENWGILDTSRLLTAFDRAGAFHFLGATSRDAALLLPLDPGAYTLQAVSRNGALGSVILEAYEVP